MGEHAKEGDAFASWLREFMRERRLKQSTFARQIGISTSVVSRWVGGQRPNPESLRLIARTFAVDQKHLMALAGHLEADEPEVSPEKSALVTLILQTDLTSREMGMLRTQIEHVRERSPDS